MAANVLGKILQLTLFGESHGAAIGAVLDGFPSGIAIDTDYIRLQMERRRPGYNHLVTQRKEEDEVEIISGVFEGKSTGAPITFLIRNKDQRSQDYEKMKDVYRPSHADFTYHKKYGHFDYRGGGRSSARVTAGIVAAGSVVRSLLSQEGIEILSWVSSIGKLSTDMIPDNGEIIEKSPVRCPDPSISERMEKEIEVAKEEGDSLGGIVSTRILNCPIGLGEPYFGKLNADLAHAMMSLNAVKGFEIGLGFESSTRKGSENNDSFINLGNKIGTETNNSGGVQGGISNGEAIQFRIAFKPASSIGKTQKTVDREGKETNVKVTGRHDPCVVPRAVPIVESLTALVIGDHLLRNKIYNNKA